MFVLRCFHFARYVLLAALLGECLPSAASAAYYSITDLGGLQGGTFSQALAVNNRGTVVGVADTSAANYVPFSYSGSTLSYLGSLGNAAGYGYALGINDAGTIVGYSFTMPGTASPYHAFIYAGGVMADIGTLGGTTSSANGINNNGIVVGSSATLGDTAHHAFTYSAGVMTDMGTLGGANSQATAVNASGAAAGFSSTAGDLATHAFLYSAGLLTDLGTLGGSNSFASGINNAGAIVGYSSNPGDSAHRGFLYQNGTMTDLGTLGGSNSFAYGVNNSGIIVGTADTTGDASTDPFVLIGGVMTNLNSALDASGAGWTLLQANSVNDSGQIVGQGFVNNIAHAFLLTPRDPLTLQCPSATAQKYLPYASSLLAAGGVFPYVQFRILPSGALPAGLVLDAVTGAITGTPSVAGPAAFSAAVTDTNGNVAATSPACNIIVAVPPPLTVVCPPASATTGVSYSSGSLNVTGGVAPYSYSIVGTLPAGLTLNTANGAVTGVPGAPGSFGIQITDSGGATAVTCPVTVAPRPVLAVTCQALTAATVGVYFSTGPMSVAGGVAPYVYSVIGTLPAGLSLNSATGAVTGTPAAAGSFSIKVADANGLTGTNCPIIVNPVVSLACPAVSASTAGVPYSSGPLAVSGGTAPFAFSIYGTLPQGLSLNTASGAVTGVPAAPRTFRVKATDARGATGTTCTITVNPPLSVACPWQRSATVGSHYSSGSLNVSGGTGPYSYSIAGTLPAGLSLNPSTGAISGTPATSGVLSVVVTDTRGATATTCQITVTGAPHQCSIPSSQTTISNTSWNHSSVASAPKYMWVHAHIGTPEGLSTSTRTTIEFTGVALTVNGKRLPMPDGRIVFDPFASSTPTTSFDISAGPSGRWTTTMNPLHLSDEIFFAGDAIPLDSDTARAGHADFNFSANSSDSTVRFSWRWSAATFSKWSAVNASQPRTGFNNAGILASHAGQHAGTPLNSTVQHSLTQGPRGGGGSDYSGLWSSARQCGCQ